MCTTTVLQNRWLESSLSFSVQHFRLQWRIASAFVSNKDNFSACVRAFFFFTSVNSSRLQSFPFFHIPLYSCMVKVEAPSFLSFPIARICTLTVTFYSCFFFFLFFRPSDGRRPDGGKIEEKKQVYNILARSRQRPLSFTSLPPAAFVSLVGRSFFLAFEVITFQLKLLFSFFVLLLLLLYVYTS